MKYVELKLIMAENLQHPTRISTH